MNWEEVDMTPMYELNEIIWKSVHGADSPMPPPVRSYHFRGLAEDAAFEPRAVR